MGSPTFPDHPESSLSSKLAQDTLQEAGLADLK